MPTFDTSSFTIPVSQLGRIADRVQDQSVLASLSPERPTLFGDVKHTRMTRDPRAQIVAEGAAKDSDTAAWDSAIASPIKFQTTVRMTQEVKWADEDHRLQIVQDLVDGIGRSMARAVDLIGLHGINPITGTQASSVTSYLNQTTQRVALADVDGPTAAFDEAVRLVVVGDEADRRLYLPTGAGLDPRFAYALASERVAAGANAGAKVNPGMGYGFNAGNLNGLQLASSSAVSGQPEAADTGVRAILGDFTQMKWGFQRRIPVELIEYGDPDGGGDLKQHNEIAYRAEGVIYVAIFDLDAFAAVDGAVAGS